MERHVMNQRIRLYLHISEREIARRAGLCAQTVSNYECGHRVRETTEQLIENEIAMAIIKCDDELLKEFCEYLIAKRNKLKSAFKEHKYFKSDNTIFELLRAKSYVLLFFCLKK